jgi:dTDP-D-glucose 4,6-dehydratase
VRRALDRRPHIVLADGGLTLDTRGYVDNLAHAVLLAVDQPGASAGQAYNCGDERMLTLRQLVEWIGRILGHEWDIVPVPCEVALPAHPLLMHIASHHRVLDLTKIRTELGYRDVVSPEEALQRTVEWLVAHRPEAGGVEETILQDPFDYEAEDRLVRMQREAIERMRAIPYANRPGPGLTYIAPEHRAAKRGGWAPGLLRQNG